MRRLVMGLAVSMAVAVAACSGTGGGDTTTMGVPGAGDPVRGLALFNGTCIACHGPGGIGAAGLGKPLTTSSFAASLTDDEMLAFPTSADPPTIR